jgi:hypothetical protein
LRAKANFLEKDYPSESIKQSLTFPLQRLEVISEEQTCMTNLLVTVSMSMNRKSTWKVHARYLQKTSMFLIETFESVNYNNYSILKNGVAEFSLPCVGAHCHHQCSWD